MECNADMDADFYPLAVRLRAAYATEHADHGALGDPCCPYCVPDADTILRAAGKLQVADHLPLRAAGPVVPDAALDEHPDPSEHVTGRDDHR